MKKKCTVVMLPVTNGRNDLMLMHNKSQGLMLLKNATELDGKFQHLYILSDDEIKELPK